MGAFALGDAEDATIRPAPVETPADTGQAESRDAAIGRLQDRIKAFAGQSIPAQQAMAKVRRQFAEIIQREDEFDDAFRYRRTQEQTVIRRAARKEYGLDFTPSSRAGKYFYAPRHLIKGSQGLGKTRAIVGGGAMLHGARGMVSAMYLPDGGKAMEAAQDYIDHATANSPQPCLCEGAVLTIQTNQTGKCVTYQTPPRPLPIAGSMCDANFA